MIVLDATNKSLIVELDATVNVTSVVSYWSIDASNVWTPRNFEVAFSLAGPVGTTILPAPGAGETRVVENIWLHMLGVFNGAMTVRLDVGAAKHNIASFQSQTSQSILPEGTTLSMDRSGIFTRQEKAFGANLLAKSPNIH